MCRLQNVLQRIILVTIYKIFIRPHLDYWYISYDQTFNNSFHDRLESIQCKGCLAIMGASRGISRERLYREVGLDLLRFWSLCRKLCLSDKIFKTRILNIFLSNSLAKLITRGMYTDFPFISKTLSSYPLSLSKIKWVLDFIFLKAYLYLGRVFCKS